MEKVRAIPTSRSKYEQVIVTNSPLYGKTRTTNLHRYLVEKDLGRKLLDDEVVHHINGDRFDNRLENLKVMSITDHFKLHGKNYGGRKHIKLWERNKKEVQYNIEPQRWYSPNEIVDQGLLFGKSKRYIFDIIKNGTLKVTNTSTSSKPQWKVYGQDLIDFIKSLENSSEDNNITSKEL